MRLFKQHAQNDTKLFCSVAVYNLYIVIEGAFVIVTYFSLLILGTLFIIYCVVAIVHMYRKRTFACKPIFVVVLTIGLGSLMLTMTVPSFTQVVTKNFKVVKGACTVDMLDAGRPTNTIFRMEDSNDSFTFKHVPKLDAYGKSVPYMCEIVTTNDDFWTFEYSIYDSKTGQLVDTYKQ